MIGLHVGLRFEYSDLGLGIFQIHGYGMATIIDRKEIGRDKDDKILYSYRLSIGTIHSGIELWVPETVIPFIMKTY